MKKWLSYSDYAAKNGKTENPFVPPLNFQISSLVNIGCEIIQVIAKYALLAE